MYLIFICNTYTVMYICTAYMRYNSNVYIYVYCTVKSFNSVRREQESFGIKKFKDLNLLL